MPLEETFDDSLAYANFLIGHIRTAKSVDAIGVACDELSHYYRALGICELLVDCDVDAFFHFLIHGALTRKYYLARCLKENGLDQPERRANLLDPFFEAVAANQLGLAGEIASMSATVCLEDFEHPSDFEYARVAHALIAPGDAGREDLRRALTVYEEVLEGRPDVRLDVCAALAHGDPKGFAEAFPLLIEDHERQMDALQDSIRSNDSTYAPNCFVFVEGLALLRIADRAGLSTLREYSRCPGLARISSYQLFVPSSFPNLPLGA